jgi:hypothetical protein
MAQSINVNRILRILAWLWMIPSTILLIVGIVLGFSTRSFIAHGTAATGKVVQLDEKTDSDGEMQYSPVFTYVAADGNTYTIRSNVWSRPAGFVVGQSVRVLYEKDDPANARLDSFWQLWLSTTVFCGIGAGFELPAALLLFFTRKLAKASSNRLVQPAASQQ